MKINVNYIDNELILEDNKILNIEIYNKKFFYRFIKDLNLMMILSSLWKTINGLRVMHYFVLLN